MNGVLPGFWYPVAAARELRSAPIARALGDTPLVLFRDRAGAPAALVDRCPHRNVPLSLGRRVADGSLACAYHGWRFDGAGECRLVPGLEEPGDASARRAISLAALEESGFVWVYSTPGKAPDSRPFRFPHLEDPSYKTVRHTQRMVGTVEAAVENALDVPHTAFLHGGLFRTSTRAHEVMVRARRFSDRVEATYSGEPVPSGLLGRMLAPGGGAVEHTDRFLLPCLSQVEYRIAGRAHLVVTTAFTPAGAREVTLFSVVSFRLSLPGFLIRPLVGPLVLRVLRQDARILKAQEENVRRFGGERFANTPLDVMGPHVGHLLRRAARGERGEPIEAEPRRMRI